MNYRQIMGGGVALLLGVTFAQPVSAQRASSWTWNMQYSTVLGLSDTKDFVDGFSWRGATVDFEKAINGNLSLGGSVGWHVLAAKEAGTSLFDQGAITGTAWRYVNSVPLLVTGSYFLEEQGQTRPFVGAGTGTYYIQNRTEAGLFAVEDGNWHFGFMGEAGVAIDRGASIITLAARYNRALAVNDVRHSYFTFSIGLRAGS